MDILHIIPIDNIITSSILFLLSIIDLTTLAVIEIVILIDACSFGLTTPRTGDICNHSGNALLFID